MSFFTGAGAGLIGSAAGFLGNIGNNRRQLQSEQRQYNYSRGLARYQNQMNMDNWQSIFNQTNAYNDPSAQMARLKNAKINPHLAYAKGGVQNTGSSPGNVQTDVKGVETAPTQSILTGVIGKYMQNKAMAIQMEEQKAKADEAKVRAELAKAGLEDKIQAQKYKSESDRRKQLNNIEVLFGFNKNAPKWSDGTKLNRYSEKLYYETEQSKIQNESMRIHQWLQRTTGNNLISNDELVEAQAAIAKAQASFFETETFKKLPPGLQSLMMAFITKVGGM